MRCTVRRGDGLGTDRAALRGSGPAGALAGRRAQPGRCDLGGSGPGSGAPRRRRPGHLGQPLRHLPASASGRACLAAWAISTTHVVRSSRPCGCAGTSGSAACSSASSPAWPDDPPEVVDERADRRPASCAGPGVRHCRSMGNGFPGGPTGGLVILAPSPSLGVTVGGVLYQREIAVLLRPTRRAPAAEPPVGPPYRAACARPPPASAPSSSSPPPRAPPCLADRGDAGLRRSAGRGVSGARCSLQPRRAALRYRAGCRAAACGAPVARRRTAHRPLTTRPIGHDDRHERTETEARRRRGPARSG